MRKHFESWTDFLFARPSFLSGIARTLDLHGDFDQYNQSATGDEADLRGLISDWIIVQRDFERSWTLLIDQNPEYLKELTEAITSDAYLCNAVMKQMNREKQNDFEMAGQGA